MACAYHAGMNAPLEAPLSRIADRVRAAAADRTPLRLRGGGSKDFFGPPSHGAPVDCTELQGILAYEPTELVVTVAAGTPLVELEAALAEKGQCLPFEPPHFGWQPNTHATVGGMVAAGWSGPPRASVGGVRDYVLGLHLINGRGEHLQYGGQAMKNVAGYDVSRLLVGSMGTLGLMTQVSLKVLPQAPAEATLVFALGQSQALQHLHGWGGQPLPLNASCWVHDPAAPGGGQDLLFVRLRGAVAAVESACKRMLAQCPGQRVDPAQAQADWARCRNQTLPFFARPSGDLVLWRLSVAPTAPALNLPWAQLVEWHGGLRWLWAAPDAGAELQALARTHGGFAMPFVAQPSMFTRANGAFDSQDPVALAVQRRIKQALDPQGIFNPGRLSAQF